MEVFRRALDHHLGFRVKQRQAESTTLVASSASSASPASRATDAAAATSGSTNNATSSGSALSAAASATPSPSDAGGHIVTDHITVPEFTATKTTPYTAHGVNATITKTGTSVYTALDYLATANATAPGIPKNELTACQINGTEHDNGPFCSPIHLQNLFVSFTYAITWNTALSTSNDSDLVVLKYTDGDQDEVWNSSFAVTDGKGYVNINMDKIWLKGQPGNHSDSGQNMTLHLVSNYQGTNESSKPGPMISLVVDPKTLPKVKIPNLPNKYGLEVGVPIGVVAAVLIFLAFWCGMRKHDRSSKTVRSHGKDYMARRARKRGRAGKSGGIQLDDYPAKRGPDDFSDEPYTGGTGNAFRDEVARQREEDDRFRPMVHSY